MNVEKLKKGDVMWGTKKDNTKHPIIFIKKLDENRFEACIMSTKPVGDNVEMDSSFFEKEKKKKSYLVTEFRYEKEYEWVKFGEKVNCLTNKGIEFVEKQTKNTPCIYCPTTIREYKKFKK